MRRLILPLLIASLSTLPVGSVCAGAPCHVEVRFDEAGGPLKIDQMARRARRLVRTADVD